MKTKYISIGGHSAETISAYLVRGEKVYNFSATDNGWSDEDSFGHKNTMRFYSPAHRLVRARRIALMAVFFVELQRGQE